MAPAKRPVITTEEIAGGGLRYVLPRPERSFGGLRLLLLGLLAVVAGIIFVLYLIRKPGDRDAPGMADDVLRLVLQGLPALMGGAMAFVRPRKYIELRQGQVRTVATGLGFSVPRDSRPMEKIERLRLMPVVTETGAASGPKAPDAAQAEPWRLVAESADLPPMELGADIPKALLLGLAVDMGQRWHRLAGRDIQIVEEDPRREEAAELDRLAQQEPPPKSFIAWRRRPEALTIVVKPVGIWATPGARVVCIVGMILAGLACGLAWLVWMLDRNISDIPPVMVVIVGVPMALGLGLIYLARKQARRYVILDVQEGGLVVTRNNLLGCQSRLWARRDIIGLAISRKSGSEAKSPPQLELQSRQGKPMPLLAGRPLDELRWISAVVNQALGLAAGGGSAMQESFRMVSPVPIRSSR